MSRKGIWVKNPQNTVNVVYGWHPTVTCTRMNASVVEEIYGSLKIRGPTCTYNLIFQSLKRLYGTSLSHRSVPRKVLKVEEQSKNTFKVKSIENLGLGRFLGVTQCTRLLISCDL